MSFWSKLDHQDWIKKLKIMFLKGEDRLWICKIIYN